MRHISLIALVFVSAAWGQDVPKVIFDTDMTGDCDDCGALAVLHALADRGEVEILGCIASYGGVPYIPGCIDAINTWYGRGDLPIGAEPEAFGRTESRYLEAIATDQARYGHDVVTKADVPDHLTVYRQLLASQPDGSVTIVTVGRLKAIGDLLESSPDAHSDLDGTALVKAKVKEWVCMGGRYPNHQRERSANFGTFGGEVATKRAIDPWPLPATFTGFEIGREILTGPELTKQSDDNPVARAYRLWFAGHEGPNKPVSRPSWDQTAILIAVRGTEPWWDVVSTGHNFIHDEGINEWLDEPDKDHRYVVKREPPEEVAAEIESLMTQTPAANPRRPNVLVVLTDDQGWGDIRSHGNDVIETPNMDALAEAGARFDRFFVSPVCAPTRASLLTGRYHMRTGVSGVTHRLETMRSEETTIAEILRDAGYVTGCFGKWHNGAHYPNHPLGQGFDEFFGFCGGHWNNYFDTTLEHNGELVKTDGYINDVVSDAALDFIERNRERPFLCYVPYNTPHSPFQVPDKYFDPWHARLDDDRLATVYAMCQSLDDNLGRLLDKLDALGIADDTIVIFFGDNGPNTDRYNGGMLGRKGSVQEGGVRNAFFMRYPRRIAPNTDVMQIAAHIDLLPTIVELTGVTMPETLPLDGKSVVPLLDGNAEDWPDRMLFSHYNGRGSVRTPQYRWSREKNREMLHDLNADPGQETDISDQFPEIANELKEAYDAWYTDVTRNGLEPPPAPVGYPEMPVVTLPAPEALLEGGVVFKGEKGWANDWVTNWTSTDDRVSWEIDVVREGTYGIALRYSCPEPDTGSEIRVDVGDQRLEAVLADAWIPERLFTPDRIDRREVGEQTWGTLTLGTLSLPKGPTRLTVIALTKPGASVMELKAVEVTFLSD